MPGAISTSSTPSFVRLEHAALGDIEHRLAQFGGIGPVEGNLPHLVDEFARAPFLQNPQAPVLDRHVEPAGGEGADEHQAPGVLADIDEAAAAGQLLGEAADIDIALGVAFGHAEASHVQPAAIVEVELLVLLDDGVGIDRGAEIEAAGRHAADHAGLGGQGDVGKNALLGRHRRHPFGHADAEIDHAASGSSQAARRAIALRMSSGSGAEPAAGTRISPAKAGL